MRACVVNAWATISKCSGNGRRLYIYEIDLVGDSKIKTDIVEFMILNYDGLINTAADDWLRFFIVKMSTNKWSDTKKHEKVWSFMRDGVRIEASLRQNADEVKWLSMRNCGDEEN